MKKICALVLSATVLNTSAVLAEPGHATDKSEAAGFGLGALIGGLLAGPPGAVIGAAGGAIYGHHTTSRKISIGTLEEQLRDKDIELAYWQDQYHNAQKRYAGNLNLVALETRQNSLRKLSEGISFSVYFRTNQATLDPELSAPLRDLVKLIREVPEIKVQLSAHADERGLPSYNLQLSRARARTIQAELINAGLPTDRIQEHAYGETKARNTDQEGYVFDRRVDIQLTLNDEV